MKILLCHCFYRTSAPSGEDDVFQNEKELLLNAGYDVSEFVRYNDDINEEGVLAKIKLGLSTSWSAKMYTELFEKIKSVKPDVVHFHNTFPQMSPSVYKACSDYGVPVVQTWHNYRMVCPNGILQRNNKPCELCLSEKPIPFSSLKYRCYRSSLLATSALALMITRNRLNGVYHNSVSKYISLTKFAAEKMIQGGFPPEKIVIKPNFLPECTLDEDVERKESDYFVFVGRLSEEKGIRTLLKACRLVKSTTLKVLGDGPLMGELKKQADDDSLNVEFLGYQKKGTILNIVKNSKFLVVPSECYEGFPMTVLEALSVGSPIVASKIGSLDEIIEDGRRIGVKFLPGDHQDLSDKIVKLLDSPDLLIEMSKNARALYECKYNAESNLEMLLDIYKQSVQSFVEI